MGVTGFADLEQASGLLAELTAGVEQVRGGAWWKIGGDELLAVGQQLELLARVVYAAQVHLAGEVDLQELGQNRGAATTPPTCCGKPC